MLSQTAWQQTPSIKSVPSKGDMVEFLESNSAGNDERRTRLIYSGAGNLFTHPDYPRLRYDIAHWIDLRWRIIWGAAYRAKRS